MWTQVKNLIGFWLVLLCAVVANPDPVVSAELTPDTSGSSECTDLLEGPIVAGDLERFHARFGKPPIPGEFEGEDLGGGVLCLNSPGGDYVVGLEIAEYLLTRSETIQTRVKTGQTCASACTFIFLAGRTLEEGETYQAAFDRAIEPGGLLGFHAPRLVLDDENAYSSNVVNQAYNLAILGAQRAHELAQNQDTGLFGQVQSFARPYVVSRFLGTPPQDLYFIDTVGDALLSQIPAYNYVAAVLLDKRLIRTICDNVFMMSDTGFGEGLSARWKSSRYLDAKSAAREFRNLSFVRNGGVERDRGNGETIKRRFEEHLTVSKNATVVGMATGYPDGFIGEAICLVTISTQGKPGDIVSFGEFTDPGSGVGFDFQNGNVVSVAIGYNYTMAQNLSAIGPGMAFDEIVMSEVVINSPLIMYPFDMPLTALPTAEDVQKAMQKPRNTSAGSRCETLWYERNLVMHRNGYCFGSAKGISTFGNAGCHTKAPSLSEEEKAFVKSVRDQEKSFGC